LMDHFFELHSLHIILTHLSKNLCRLHFKFIK